MLIPLVFRNNWYVALSLSFCEPILFSPFAFCFSLCLPMNYLNIFWILSWHILVFLKLLLCLDLLVVLLGATYTYLSLYSLLVSMFNTLSKVWEPYFHSLIWSCLTDNIILLCHIFQNLHGIGYSHLFLHLRCYFFFLMLRSFFFDHFLFKENV